MMPRICSAGSRAPTGTPMAPARTTAHSATASSMRLRVQRTTRSPRRTPRATSASVARRTSPASASKATVVPATPGSASGVSSTNAVRAP
jgi:hypothetical protein